jgi:excisionase family DNA binding protein
MEQLSIDLTSRPARREALIDIAAVADRLGVSVRYVRRLVDEDRIPYYKFGRPLRFDPAEIDAWLEQARRGASAT